MLLHAAKRTRRVVVAAANVLHLGLVVGQRRLGDGRHIAVGRVAGRRTGNGAGRRDARAPGAATAFHCELKGVARFDDQVLGVLVAQIEGVHVVHLDDGVAHLDARLVGQTADVDLRAKGLHYSG